MIFSLGAVVVDDGGGANGAEESLQVRGLGQLGAHISFKGIFDS